LSTCAAAEDFAEVVDRVNAEDGVVDKAMIAAPASAARERVTRRVFIEFPLIVFNYEAKETQAM
jgi:hypothetical protein